MSSGLPYFPNLIILMYIITKHLFGHLTKYFYSLSPFCLFPLNRLATDLHVLCYSNTRLPFPRKSTPRSYQRWVEMGMSMSIWHETSYTILQSLDTMNFFNLNYHRVFKPKMCSDNGAAKESQYRTTTLNKNRGLQISNSPWKLWRQQSFFLNTYGVFETIWPDRVMQPISSYHCVVYQNKLISNHI